MSKNIVILCDGTGNEVKTDLSNVVKLYRILRKNTEQIVFYDPGIGTIGNQNSWLRKIQKVKQGLCLAFGIGLDENVLDAYKFLIDNYQDGDKIFLFGFSRGAYTVRVLAGFIRLIGLLSSEQKNLCDYAFNAYKQSNIKNDLTIGWNFAEVTRARKIPIKFLGVWDTVSSVLIPRLDRFFGIDQQVLPYTAKNELIEVFRHAIAIDERRRMFPAYQWRDPQEYKSNPFSSKSNPQDIKQVWFSGCHSDIGGGYSEKESGLAKFPLVWMVNEAKLFGLHVNTAMFNQIAMGISNHKTSREYAAPNIRAIAHNSLTLGWKLFEWMPRQAKYKTWPGRYSLFGFYIPWAEPRYIAEGSCIHRSVTDRIREVSGYRPINMPSSYKIEQ